MKSMQIGGWTVVLADGKKQNENLLTVLSFIINNSAEDLPNGMEQFRFLQRVAVAFDEAEKTKVLKLEDKDHQVLVGLLEKNIPSRWALSKDISAIVEEFLDL